MSVKKQKARKHEAVGSRSRAKPKGLDLEAIDEKKLRKRLSTIYELESARDAARRIHDLQKANFSSAKAELEAAEEALANEIRDQRGGMGPLYEGVSGASSETKDAAKDVEEKASAPAEKGDGKSKGAKKPAPVAAVV